MPAMPIGGPSTDLSDDDLLLEIASDPDLRAALGIGTDPSALAEFSGGRPVSAPEDQGAPAATQQKRTALPASSSTPIKPSQGTAAQASSGNQQKQEEMAQLLSQLESAQHADDHQAHQRYRSELAMAGGDAIAAAFAGLPPMHRPTTKPVSRAEQVKDKIDLREKMLSGQSSRDLTETKTGLNTQKIQSGAIDLSNKHARDTNGSPESEYIRKIWRAMTNVEPPDGLTGEDLIAVRPELKIFVDKKIAEDKALAQENQFQQRERRVTSEGDKNRAAGIGTAAMRIDATQSGAGNRAAGENAKNQAERQIVGRDDLAPHSATDKTAQSEMDGAFRGFEAVGNEMINIMRKHGRNFPGSTAWKNLASSYMAINQIQNHINRNGVMNFKDKDNNDIQIGNAQAFMQYVLNNGPDVLEHAIHDNKKMLDMNAMAHNYGPLHEGWKPKSVQDYMDQRGSGMGSSTTTQNPNVAPDITNWANSGGKGKFPTLRDPSAQPGGQTQAGASGQPKPPGIPPPGMNWKYNPSNGKWSLTKG